MSSRLDNIKRRWTAEQKVSKNDVAWLLDMATAGEKALAAEQMQTKVRRPFDLLDDLLGGQR
jgi:hypothetical protein